jgi:NAD(P)H-nitrite reductase large subunit
MVLVVVGVRPDTTLTASAGATLGVKGAIEVDEGMRTNLPGIFAAGDCVITHHRLLGTTWLPLGTTRQDLQKHAMSPHGGFRVAGGLPGGIAVAATVRAVAATPGTAT